MRIQLGQDAAISSASLTNFSRRDSAEMEAWMERLIGSSQEVVENNS